jgi:hypothetical protein
MSAIISVKSQFKIGKVSISHLELLWKQFPVSLHPKLLVLMEKFEVAFRLKGDPDFIFIPSLLPEEKPVEVTDIWPRFPSNQQHQIGRSWQFPFVPVGFFPRLLSRLVQQFTGKAPILWRNGLTIRVSEVC